MNVITTALLLLKGWHLHFHNSENPEQKIRRNPGYWILDPILVFNPPKNNVCRYWVKRTTTGDIISRANMVDLLDSLSASHFFDILCFQQTYSIFQIHPFFATRGLCLNLLIKRFWFIQRTMFNFYYCETWNTALRKAIQFLCIENQIFCSISYLSAGPKLLLYFALFRAWKMQIPRGHFILIYFLLRFRVLGACENGAKNYYKRACKKIA